jgi:peptide/nickel transport system substrate-binding protein
MRTVMLPGPRVAAIGCFLVITACGPAVPAQTALRSGDEAAAPRRVGPSRVTAAIGAEITSLASKLEPQRTYGGEYGFLSNSPLALLDEKGAASPLLAAELPSRAAGTWTVNADGTMATTWKIRPNAVWHDGESVVAKDFAFALRVYADPAIPIREREPERFMERIEPLDSKTFVIYWKQPYPWASEITTRQLEALPEHLMGSVFEMGDRDAFLNHGFWTSASYIGNGPYRLVQWDLGSQLMYRAFDDYFMGRPKIDEFILKIIPDTNTLVSNILSGAVDTTLGITLGLQAAATVRKQWAQTGEGQVVIVPARLRYTQIQFDPVRNQQPALYDVRVRRAIVHGIDRETLAEIVTEGTSGAADVVMAPTDPLFPRVQQAIATYPYDPVRAAELLQQAGWTRRGDVLADVGGQAFGLDLRTTQGRDNETEANVMAADLSKLGMQMSQSVVPQSRISDTEFRVTFPGINVTATLLDVPASMNLGHSEQCAVAERRYVGVNRGCWKHADYDRLFITASSSLDSREREAAAIEGLRIITEEVGVFGLSYSSEGIAVRHGLIGPGQHWPPQVGTTWNVHQWTWQ